MTRLLCTGDWHVGSGLDYGRTPQDRLADQQNTVEKIVDLAITHEVDAVLLAGDLWHRRRPTPAELVAVWEPLRRLHVEHGCDVLAINGNHCVEAADGPVALDLFADFIDVHRKPGIWKTRGGLSVATLPWAPVSRLVAARNGGNRDDLNREAAGLLLATARGLQEQIEGPAVLLLHWSISGAATPTGVMTDEFREVVLPLEELDQLCFDAIVAGHIHKPQQMADGIFYVGSPAPVDFGEAASDHGAWLLEIGDEPTTATFLPIESRPFVTIDFDLANDIDSGMLVNGFASEAEEAVVRLRYSGTEEQARRVDHAAVTRSLYASGAHRVYAIQPTILREARTRVAGVDEDLAPLAALDMWIDAEGLQGWERDSLRELGARYLEAVAA